MLKLLSIVLNFIDQDHRVPVTGAEERAASVPGTLAAAPTFIPKACQARFQGTRFQGTLSMLAAAPAPMFWR